MTGPRKVYGLAFQLRSCWDALVDFLPYLQPFVCPMTDAHWRYRDGNLDVYWPTSDSAGPRPAIVFVHGGPLPADQQPTPRDWPVFAGYAALAAERGVTAAVVDHQLHDPKDYPAAAGDVAAAVARTRELDGVDPHRVALWFFSGGDLLAADWLAGPPAWLRCLAASYPVLAPPPDWNLDARFRPAEAVANAGAVPIVVTRVGRERAEFAAAVENFVTSAENHQVNLEMIDVPNGQHAFDVLDHTEESRRAVGRAMSRVETAIRG